jgi:hypothetical protein
MKARKASRLRDWSGGRPKARHMPGQGLTTSPSTTKVWSPARRIMVMLRAASLFSDEVIAACSPARDNLSAQK